MPTPWTWVILTFRRVRLAGDATTFPERVRLVWGPLMSCNAGKWSTTHESFDWSYMIRWNRECRYRSRSKYDRPFEADRS